VVNDKLNRKRDFTRMRRHQWCTQYWRGATTTRTKT